MEGDEPDAEELVHGDVEEEGGFVEGWVGVGPSVVRPGLNGCGGLICLGRRGKWGVEKVGLTNAVDRDVDVRAHDFVPPVDAPDEPARAGEGAGAAEGVDEGGRGREVPLQGCALQGGGRLGEVVDYLGDFGDCGGGLGVSCWSGVVGWVPGSSMVGAGDVFVS